MNTTMHCQRYILLGLLAFEMLYFCPQSLFSPLPFGNVKLVGDIYCQIFILTILQKIAVIAVNKIFDWFPCGILNFVPLPCCQKFDISLFIDAMPKDFVDDPLVDLSLRVYHCPLVIEKWDRGTLKIFSGTGFQKTQVRLNCHTLPNLYQITSVPLPCDNHCRSQPPRV